MKYTLKYVFEVLAPQGCQYQARLYEGDVLHFIRARGSWREARDAVIEKMRERAPETPPPPDEEIDI
jgi:hypothetical protein